MKRLYALDALRGLAALSVVVWHWQHFFAISGTEQPDWRPEWEPFFHVLRPLYGAGWMAVDLFFALSGFVFYWLYAEAIANGRIGAGAFTLLRFSRLYPLHFVALLLVTVLEFVFQRQTGHFFIYESGDWARFAAALSMAQQWLPPTMQQVFNGPAWSVSVEVLLYIVFFAICRWGLTGPVWALGIAFGALAVFAYNQLIARGLMGFFLGGAVFYFTERIRQAADARHITRLVIAAALFCWLVMLGQGYFGIVDATVHWIAGRGVPSLWSSYQRQSDFLLPIAFIFILGPLTIAALVLGEGLPKRHAYHWGKGVLSFLGDISYSTYLLHFPLQLVFVLMALRFGGTSMTFMHPLVMPGFFVLLIGLGAASHYGFEKPMQSMLRSGLNRRKTQSV